jgi:phenylalanyl-tRNA synthetase beta chain
VARARPQRGTKDLTIPEDLIEEVGRMHGYGRIPDQALTAPLHPAPWNERNELVQTLTERLGAAAGFHEAMTYSFVDSAVLAALGLADEPYVRLANPQSEGSERVRRTVLPSLLAHLAKNRRQRAEVRLFEIGKGYLPENASERGEPLEVHELAMVWMRPRTEGAGFAPGAFGFLQGVLEDLLRAACKPGARWQPAGARPPWAHPVRAIVAPDDAGGPIALVAGLEPEAQARLGLTGELDGEVACGVLSLDRLLAQPDERASYRPLPRFPGVKVDVAAAVPESCAAGTLQRALREAGKGLVESCELFDLYRGASLGDGRKSLAYHVLLQAEDRTLTDQDCAKYLARVERALAELGGELRKV